MDIKKNILIFGANGMLGRYVCSYLSKNPDWNIIQASRKNLNIGTVNKQEIWYYLKARDIDVVINCAGIIKPRVEVVGRAETIKVNSWFPHVLAELSEELNFRLYHITTDCVFSGTDFDCLINDIPYTESSKHSATDLYGLSKSMGEPVGKNVMCLRTSIIGLEKEQGRSLLNWVISQNGKEVNGYVNHRWNGITCLQLAKSLYRLVNDEIKFNHFAPVYHISSSQYVSKYELLKMINKVYDLDLKIKEHKDKSDCYRVLGTKLMLNCNLNIPPLMEQLLEMKEYDDNLLN